MLPFLRRTAPKTLLLGSLGTVIVLGFIDWLTGSEYGFSLFYLLPITVTTWYVGRYWGVVVALLSAATWSVADVLGGTNYSSVYVPIWNTGVRLAFFLITLFLQNAYRTALRRAEALALTDPLTGAVNLRSLEQLVARDLAAIERQPQPVSLAFLDLDHFKQVNDQRGHAEGDKALRLVTDTLHRHLRRTDVLARLGGDEFALWLPGTDEASAVSVLARLRAALAEAMRAADYPITFSVGVVTYPAAAPTLEAMLGAADALMYEVKASSRNDFRHKIVTV